MEEHKVQTAARIWFKPPLHETLRKPLLVYFPVSFQDIKALAFSKMSKKTRV